MFHILICLLHPHTQTILRIKNENCEKEMPPEYQSFYGNTTRCENIWSYIPGLSILDLKRPMPYRIGGLVTTVINLNPLHLSTVKSQPDSRSRIFQTLHVPPVHSLIAQLTAVNVINFTQDNKPIKISHTRNMSNQPSKYN